MYKEDRCLLLQLCKTNNPESSTEPAPPAPTLNNSVKQPRSILVDKQFTSEPPTPTMKHQPRPMQRNHSDLSQRIKKRVTYRLLSLNDPLDRTIIDKPFIPEHSSLSEQIVENSQKASCNANSTDNDVFASTPIDEFNYHPKQSRNEKTREHSRSDRPHCLSKRTSKSNRNSGSIQFHSPAKKRNFHNSINTNDT